ncbi:MAG: AcrB/AcrD/AcrF family protein [Allosphingosinicella sp.]|uniref:AcrB/AcrD/AcrF family protein n=1 Tax=Allosphingosinicella sp. TaxID=2823234 RepID=UPI00394A2478
MEGGAIDRFSAQWRIWVALFWLATAALLIWNGWNGIRWFSLGDTDDNMRMMQVRAWLDGQHWFDLRQYRMAPPTGADIHWSRLVDLPIAGIKLLLQPMIGGAHAERAAVAIAPLLPLLLAFYAVALAGRRLVSPRAFALAVGLFVCAHSARSMFAPLRIDHHGWQLAFLALALAALVDPKRARGGATLGIATALSLVIGMEMLPYLAVAGAATVLMWIRDPAEAPRLATYGAALAGGCALGFLLFASWANRGPVCDALSPVWLSAMTAAGAIAVALAWASPARLPWRLAAAAAGGALLAAAFALLWPDCLGRLEQVPAELDRLWLSKVREALPIYRHPWRVGVVTASLPLIGLVGYAAMIWRSRRDPELMVRWAAAGLLGLLAAALLLWQIRAAPAAQLLAVPGVTGLAWLLIGWFQGRRFLLLRAGGTVAAFVLVSGLGTHYLTRLFPEQPTEFRERVNLANRRCPTLPALRPIAQQPPGTVFTFVDMGPRLITVTPHSAIAGPYHRNHEAIIDVMRAWRGDAGNFRRTADKYAADYVLICPGMSESTIYRAEARDGFYRRLSDGEVPDWLDPVQLPPDSPFRMWRIRR